MRRVGLLALLFALGLPASGPIAHAEQRSPKGSLFVRLAPSADELQRERTAALERRLAQLLSRWPGVSHAEVQLTLPRISEQPLDRPLPAPRAAVVLTRSTDEPRAEVVLKLLQSALPTLDPRDLTVLDHTASPIVGSRADAPDSLTKPQPAHTAASPRAQAQPPMSTARAGATASETSISRLRVGLATSLAVNALLAAIVLWRLRRYRPAAQKVDPQARLPSPP